MWNVITGIIKEMKKCEEAGAIFAAVAMAFVCIDTMAYLSMPNSQSKQEKQDFIDWVNTYLKGHPDQPYQYDGIDVYAARCALLHTFGAEAKLHREDPSIMMFVYHNGGKHLLDLNESPNLVIIGTASFLNDVAIAVKGFRKACQEDETLRTRVESRLPKVSQYRPL